jgi:hypothetical protein
MRKLYPKEVLNYGHRQKRNVERPGKGWGYKMSLNGDKVALDINILS